jgi:hypothetical protein
LAFEKLIFFAGSESTDPEYTCATGNNRKKKSTGYKCFMHRLIGSVHSKIFRFPAVSNCGFLAVTNVNEKVLTMIENPRLKINVDPKNTSH